METKLAKTIRKIDCFKDVSKEGLDLILNKCYCDCYLNLD